MHDHEYVIVSQEVKAQADFSLKYVTDIVTSLVKDSALASQVNAAVTSKLTEQKNKFVAAYRDEACDDDLTVEFK